MKFFVFAELPNSPPLGFHWSPEVASNLKGLILVLSICEQPKFHFPESQWQCGTYWDTCTMGHTRDGLVEIYLHLHRGRLP